MRAEAMPASALRPPRLSYSSVSGLMLLAALIGIAVADIPVTSLDPSLQLRRLAAGSLRGDRYALGARRRVSPAPSALTAVVSGPSAGRALALGSPDSPAVRMTCAFLRSIHEMFWALLLIQVTGLSPTTGILAVA